MRNTLGVLVLPFLVTLGGRVSPQLGIAVILVFVCVGSLLFARLLDGGPHAWSRATRRLRSWGRRNGYTIDSSSPVYSTEFFSRWPWGGFRPDGGPSEWNESTTSAFQRVFRITATARNGQSREGWARLGGYFLGQMSPRVDVVWDDDITIHNPL
jgi:hypothetical protein